MGSKKNRTKTVETKAKESTQSNVVIVKFDYLSLPLQSDDHDIRNDEMEVRNDNDDIETRDDNADISGDAKCDASEPKMRKKREYELWSKEKIETAKRLYDSGAKPKIIAIATGKSLRAVQLFISRKLTKKRVHELENPPKRGRKDKSDKTQLRDKIIEILQNDCALNMYSIWNRLPNELRGVTSKDIVQKELKKMKFSKKRLQMPRVDRNTINIMTQRQEFVALIDMLPDSQKIYFGETGFSLTPLPKFGWSPEGETPNLEVVLKNHRMISLLAAINSNGIITYEIIDGAYDNGAIENFIIKLIGFCPDESVLILDNSKFNFSANLIETLNINNITVRYLPPHSIELNPIEGAFSLIKKVYNDDKPQLNDIPQLKEEIEKIANFFMSYSFVEYYERSHSYHELALNLQPF